MKRRSPVRWQQTSPRLGSGSESQEPPQSVATFGFEASALREITPRQRGVYRGVISLILSENARDFHTAQKITAASVQKEKIDDHHIFPKAWLSASKDPDRKLVDCVLNRTLIDRITNILIGKRPPSEYLREIAKTVGASQVAEILSSHVLPNSSDSGLWKDSFGQFLQERQELLGSRIREVTGSVV